MENKAQKAKEIIERIKYATIATASKLGEPWNTPVRAVFDAQYNFYWVSWLGTQHSKNIAENPSVFIVIYDSTVPEGSGEGVYLKASAAEITDPAELQAAIAFVYAKKNEPARAIKEFQEDSPRRMYRAVVERAWVNLDVNMRGSIVDTREEITLL